MRYEWVLIIYKRKGDSKTVDCKELTLHPTLEPFRFQVYHTTAFGLYHAVRQQESQQFGVLTLQQNIILISSYRGHIEEKVTFHGGIYIKHNPPWPAIYQGKSWKPNDWLRLSHCPLTPGHMAHLQKHLFWKFFSSLTSEYQESSYHPFREENTDL